MAEGSDGSKGNPSLGAVLDGAEEPILTIKESSPSVTEHLIDGVPAAQAFRHREVDTLSVNACLLHLSVP